MTTWAVVFLGMIAVATTLTSIIQIGFIVYAGRLARRMEQLTNRVERDMQPVMARLQSISGDAARAASLAAAQVERADQIVSDFARRIDQTFTLVQQTIITPARHGSALVVGIRAGLAALRETRRRGSGGALEDEDALFIG